MKKLVSLALALSLALSLAACSGGASSSTPTEPSATVTVASLNGAKETVEVAVPYDPQRIAVLDMAALDILDALGVGDRVVGTADTSLDYLQGYIGGGIADLGTIKEADLEAVMACDPDVIFIGGRLATSYDALSEIAPVVYLSTDTDLGVVESVRRNAATIASLFGLEDRAEELMAGFDGRIAALSDFAADKTAIVGMCTSGSFNVLGNDGRCSIIGRELALTTSAWTPPSTPPPTATRPPSSSWWTRTPTTSSSWTGTPPLPPRAPSWLRRSWKTNWSWGPTPTKTAASSTWPTPPCGIPPRAASPPWTPCSPTWRASSPSECPPMKKAVRLFQLDGFSAIRS